MKIVTCNVNGIRSAHRKGFFDWYKKQKADVLCLQELIAQKDQTTSRIRFFQFSRKCGMTHSKTKIVYVDS